MVEFTQKMAKICEFSPFFGYRRIGHLGRIFGTEYSADFCRIFGRIFGIRSYTNIKVKVSKKCHRIQFHVTHHLKPSNHMDRKQTKMTMKKALISHLIAQIKINIIRSTAKGSFYKLFR